MPKKIKTETKRADEILTLTDAIAKGAVDSGCSVFTASPMPYVCDMAGYLNKRANKLEQDINILYMQSARSAVSAAVGAGLTGKKVMSASYGLSSIIESIEYAVSISSACVILGVSKTGPSGADFSKTSQEDLSILKLHNLFENIAVLSPYSASDAYECTIRAFNIAEQYKMPVLILCDSFMCGVYENFKVSKSIKPLELDEKALNKKVILGTGSNMLVKIEQHDKNNILDNADDMIKIEAKENADAEVLLISFGITARSCLEAVRIARSKNIKLGLLCFSTLWPLKKETIQKLISKNLKKIFVCELNKGAFASSVHKILPDKEIIKINKTDGELLMPYEILMKIKENMTNKNGE